MNDDETSKGDCGGFYDEGIVQTARGPRAADPYEMPSRGRYQHRTAAFTHTEAHIDAYLEALLPCENANATTRTLARLAELYRVGIADDGKHRDGRPIADAIWKRLLQYGGILYTPGLRCSRAGLPWTWYEKNLLQQFFEKKTDAVAKRPPPAYVALFFGRPEAEVVAAARQYGPARGRPGFVQAKE
jgi:hypothetical protein